MQTFDLTPDPKVLIALTHTPMQPMDALCELIDNALDSFKAAALQGSPVKHQLVIINLPRQSELCSGVGCIQIRDNGSGLNHEQAEKALRVGFSGNNPYDSLGLFGMGFNISTGKLARITRFMTARLENERAIEITVDLEAIKESRSFKVPVNEVAKPTDFERGTLVEISGWWPEGNPNSGFIRKLVQYGTPKIRDEIGRRYATILREGRVQIVINDIACQPFEHCVWADSRFVERRGSGKVPAIFRFDELIGTQLRCTACAALVESGLNNCKACGSSCLRTVEERVRGWVGIQRFDDATDFGIDLIRNGRAIRIGEKAAFFEFTDEFKRTFKDYPIDSTFGRIVGEVHLNHVPVDFLKQDFQRSSPEWLRAISYLRGDSSLQPMQPGAEKNQSPVFKLYQGYRRVRTFGRADLYMGVWDDSADGPRRISRDVEREYAEKFKQKLPGFYDDAEWWKLVEQADKRPRDELVECPECSAQNLKGHDTCVSCGQVLIGKACINPECNKIIPQSAASCQHCGQSQIPEIEQPWTCEVCGAANKPDFSSCSECTSIKGTLNPLSREFLLANASKADDLSIPACTVQLADESNSSPLDVKTFVTRQPIQPKLRGEQIPLFAIKSPESVELFVDLNHILFKSFRVRPEQMIAAEVALVLFDANRRLSGHKNQGIHTLSTLEWQILQKRWGGVLEDSAAKVKNDIQAFFEGLRERLPDILRAKAGDIYDDLNDRQQKLMVDNVLGRGIDVKKLSEMCSTGQYLLYVDETTIVELFKKYASNFFDEKFWSVSFNQVPGLPGAVIEDVQQRAKALYLNCLEDIASYLRYQQPDSIVVQRGRASLQFLQQKIS